MSKHGIVLRKLNKLKRGMAVLLATGMVFSTVMPYLDRSNSFAVESEESEESIDEYIEESEESEVNSDSEASIVEDELLDENTLLDSSESGEENSTLENSSASQEVNSDSSDILIEEDTSLLSDGAVDDLDADNIDTIALFSNDLEDPVDETLQSLIDNAKDGDTIRLERDYSENVIISDGKNIVIDLNGFTLSPVAAEGTVNHFTVYGTLTITDSKGGGKFYGQNQEDVRAIYVAKNAAVYALGGTITGYKVTGNGAAVFVENQKNEGGKFVLDGALISGNHADEFGGAIFSYDTDGLCLVSGTLSENSAKSGGAVAYYHATVLKSDETEIGQVTFSKNSAEENGGAVYVDTDAVCIDTSGSKEVQIPFVIDQAVFTQNTAELNGGAVYLYGGMYEINNSTFTNNHTLGTSGAGGAVFVNTSSNLSFVNDSFIENDTSGNAGGAVYTTSGTSKTIRGSLYLEDCTFNKNTFVNPGNNRGAGLFAGAYYDIDIYGCEMTENTMSYEGSAAFFDGYSTITLQDSAKKQLNVSRNTFGVSIDKAYGGGLFFAGKSTVTINSGLFEDNKALTPNSNGAAIGTDSPLIINGGTFRNNASRGNGGAIYANANVTITGDAEFYNNTATSNGGALFDNSSTVTVSGNANIHNNVASSSGGGIYTKGALKITNLDSTKYEKTNVLIHDNTCGANGGGFAAENTTVLDSYFEIYNNTSDSGGGVFLDSSANLNMSAGKIYNNTAKTTAGAIYSKRRNLPTSAVSPTDFHGISGGEIYGNKSNGSAGAIYIVSSASGEAAWDSCHFFTISGGKIHDNTAATNGGAILLGARSILVVEGGSITGNTAGNMGGGIASNSLEVRATSMNALYANIDIREGAIICENNVTNTSGGNDIALNSGKYTSTNEKYPPHVVRPTLSFCQPKKMGNGTANSVWHDDINDAVISTSFDNKQEAKMLQDTSDVKYYYYTFMPDTKKIVAEVDNQKFTSVQAAIDYIYNNNVITDTASGTAVIKMVDHSIENVVLATPASGNRKVVLNLNGFTLSGLSSSVVTVKEGAELTVVDQSADKTGKITGGAGTIPGSDAANTYGGAFYVDGHLTLKDVLITENKSRYGGAIFVSKTGTLDIDGAVISNNSSADKTDTGAAIRVEGGTVNLKNGEISGHTQTAVYLSSASTFNMSGGSVIDNVKNASSNAGAFYIGGKSSFTMTGGLISKNGINGTGNGGAICLSDSKLTLTGGEISKNFTTGGNGGAIDVEKSGDVSIGASASEGAAVITGNTALTGNGGGIYFNNIDDKTPLNYIKGKIYGNVSSAGNDIFTVATATINKIYPAESMGIDGIDCWDDAATGEQYVVGTGSSSINSLEGKQDVAHYLTATKKGNHASAVARIYRADSENGKKEYVSLQEAMKDAKTGEIIYLLADITEGISCVEAKNVTVDLNGYTISVPEGKSAFDISGANVTVRSGNPQQEDYKNESTGGVIRPLLGVEKSRAAYVRNGSFTLESGTIDGFSGYVNGGAIYKEASNTASVNIKGGVIQNCSADNGGAIFAKFGGDVEITGGKFINCSAKEYGGAIYILPSANTYPTVLHIKSASTDPEEKVTFEGCSAGTYGGAIGVYYYAHYNPTISSDSLFTQSEVVIDNAIFNNCEAATSGGAVYVIGRNYNESTSSKYEVKIENSTFTGNMTEGNGGAIYTNNISTSLTGNTISRNSANNGAGVYLTSDSKTNNHNFIISDNTVSYNTAGGTCGGMYISGGDTLTVSGGKVDHNNANNHDGNSGGMYINGRIVSVKDIEVSYNYAFNGGGINLGDFEGTATFANCDIHHNSAIRGGGILFNVESAVEKILLFNGGTKVHDNVANAWASNASYGGGLCMARGVNSSTTLKLEDTKWYNNKSYGTYSHSNDMNGGGAIYCGGQNYYANKNKVIISSGAELYNNEASLRGGAILLMRADLVIEGDAKIYGNSARDGGAVCQYLSSNGDSKGNTKWETAHKFTMTGGTISDNKAIDNGGAFYFTNMEYAYNPAKVDLPMDSEVFFLGGSVSSNYAGNNGGAIYSGIRVENLSIGGTKEVEGVSTNVGTVITENVADGFGGGIYGGTSGAINAVSISQGNKTNVNVIRLNQGGQIYDNHASLGQDIYEYCNKNYLENEVRLISAFDMFSNDPSKNGIAWYDETTGDVITDRIKGKIIRDYPLTLEYRTNETTAIVEKADGSGYAEFDTVQKAVDALVSNPDMYDGSHTIIMVHDSTENVMIPSEFDGKLKLNGYTLRGSGDSAISAYGKLTVVDTETGDSKKITFVDGSGTEKNYETKNDIGTITGTSSVAGGGIHVYSGGNVTFASGQIKDCRAGGQTADNMTYGGGAVAIDSGTFTLSGGSIHDNYAYQYGGAVITLTPSSVFVMTGGEIKDNGLLRKKNYIDEKTYGGGIFLYQGKANIYGGEISGNKAFAGAGISVNSKASLNISGEILSGGEHSVKILDNEAYSQGGGIYSIGTSTSNTTVSISGALISGNKTVAPRNTTVNTSAGLTESAGGGLFIAGSTVVLDANTVIRENTARRGAGCYVDYGQLIMLGGVITRNTADLGGGIAINPLRENSGNEPTKDSVISIGGVYDNLSLLTSAGNDIYSHIETNTEFIFSEKKNSITLLPAEDMGDSRYNVWRDDDYSGVNRVGELITKGQYVTGNINEAQNVMLTASKYNAVSTSEYDTDVKITTLLIQKTNSVPNPDGEGTIDEKVDGLIDGTSLFDNGQNDLESSADEEVLVCDLPDSRLSISPETYKLNGNEYHYYIVDGDSSKLYEQNQIYSWKSGCDSNNTNSLVRSYDSANYSFEMTLQADQNKYHKVQIWFEARLDADSKDASFVRPAGMNNAVILNRIDEEGNPYQLLRGYFVHTFEGDSGTTGGISIPIEIYGMKNGDTIKPSFKAWIGGNEENKQNAPCCDSKILTVSSAPLFNVTLDYNTALSYTGYFDLNNHVEVTKSQAMNGDTVKDGYVYGTVLGYGMTVELYNLLNTKKMKGLEFPMNGLEFDVAFKGNLTVTTDDGVVHPVDQGAIPYFWAYKENEKTLTGRPVGGTSNIVNMDWNDEDDIVKTTNYAYNAAPLNSGGGSNAVYNGGAWTITEGTPVSGINSRVAHVKVTGYEISPSLSDFNPTANGDGSASNIYNSDSVKAFTAGYIQIIYPIDPVSASEYSGYLSIDMQAAAYNLEISGTSGQAPSEVYEVVLKPDGLPEYDLNGDLQYQEKGLNTLNNFFNYPSPHTSELLTTLAKNETHYADNYAVQSTGLYVYNGDGPGTTLNKTNYFKGVNSKTNKNVTVYSPDKYLSGKEGKDGDGTTPLASQIYIGGAIKFVSDSFMTDDKVKYPQYYIPDELSEGYTEKDLFNPQIDNKIETYYLTAFDLFQKFDGEAFVPVGTNEPIINKRYALTGQSNNIENGSFVINTTEGPADWYEQGERNDPMQYNLTILYAAKKDGSNWERKEIDFQSKYGISGSDAVYTDGGVADMDQGIEKADGTMSYGYMEDQLIYFDSMDALHSYFADKEDGGYCVGILYQFRDCVIRTGRSVSCEARANVTDDFNMTGKTYATTNDVVGWITYRPYYKAAATGLNLHGVDYDKSTLVYDVNGTATGYDAEKNYYVVPTLEKLNGTSLSSIDCSKYFGNYGMTQYSYGTRVPGSHGGGDVAGNSLLLYTLDTSIIIRDTDTIYGSNGKPKRNYVVSEGERIANFELSPSVGPSSATKNHELVTNGSQAAEITIEVTLPSKISFKQGTLSFVYQDKGYQNGDLLWTTEEVLNDDGTSKVILKTHVSDISKALPKIQFSTLLGTPDNPSTDFTEAESGNSYAIVAAIRANYEEINRIAAETHTNSETIVITKKTSNSIYKDVESTLNELGDDLVYTLHFTNTGEEANNMELVDVLPYNGDGRETSFSGGYQLKSVQIHFVGDSEGYNKFITDSNAAIKVLTSPVVVPKDDVEMKSTRQEAYSSGTLLSSDSALIKAEGVVCDETNLTITYYLKDKAVVQYAGTTNTPNLTTKGAPAIFAAVPYVAGKKSIVVTVTLSPVEKTSDGKDQLIKTPYNSTTQKGNDLYQNSFYYGNGLTASGNVGNPLMSGVVGVRVVDRAISGVVWLDMDHDGIYNGLSTDKVIKNADVYLYEMNGDELSPAKDILGNEVQKITTADDGKYMFTALKAGNYIVKVYDDGKDYLVKGFDMSSVTKATDTQPVPFSKLSVTKLESDDKFIGNKTVAEYDTDNLSLADAMLNAMVVLPSKDGISGGQYTAANKNCGLYYYDLSIEKQWVNYVEAVPTGHKVVFTVVGKTKDAVVSTNIFTMEKTDTGVKLILPDGSEKKLDDRNPGFGYFHQLTAAEANDANRKVYRWLLDNIPLQAETKEGVITYTASEKAYDKEGAILRGTLYTPSSRMDEESMDAVSGRHYFKAENKQVLYRIDLTKFSMTQMDLKLDGAEYGLYSDENCTLLLDRQTSGTYKEAGAEGTLSEVPGVLEFKNLKAGTYFIKEISAPNGYSLNNTIYKVVITYENAENTISPTVKLYEKKVASADDGESSQTQYAFIKEGNALVSADADVTDLTDYIISWDVSDMPLYKLPKTGGIGTYLFTFFGMAFMALAILIIRKKWMERSGR